MADNVTGVRISELTVAQSLNDTDMFPIETRAPESKQVTWEVMKDHFIDVSDDDIAAIYDELYLVAKGGEK